MIPGFRWWWRRVIGCLDGVSLAGMYRAASQAVRRMCAKHVVVLGEAVLEQREEQAC